MGIKAPYPPSPYPPKAPYDYHLLKPLISFQALNHCRTVWTR